MSSPASGKGKVGWAHGRRSLACFHVRMRMGRDGRKEGRKEGSGERSERGLITLPMDPPGVWGLDDGRPAGQMDR